MVKRIVNKNSTGLTLSELLVVITIIAVLLLIAAISLRSQVFKGYDARIKTDLHQITVGLEEYEKDNNCYPTALPCGTGTEIEPYMESVPCDPETRGPYKYQCESGDCPGWYWLFADLEYETAPGIAELGCTTGCGPNVDETDYNYYVSSPNAPEVFVAPYPAYGCFSGDVCVGIMDEDPCDPHYDTEANCLARCPMDGYCD